MNYFNPQREVLPRVLATDLDGTLIPLPDSPSNVDALSVLSKARRTSGVGLVYATGRHYESVVEAIREYRMPEPDWIICDVGSSIYQRRESGYENFSPFEIHLKELSGGMGRGVIEQQLQSVEGLTLQAPDHQQQFKISYESTADTVEGLVARVNQILKHKKLPFECMGSLDPFLNCGLLDVLPQGVSKAYALLWLSMHANFKPDEVVFSGDSGNDYAALVSGFRAIIVANASKGLAAQVQEELKSRHLEDRLYLAKGNGTSGVLEGCQYFGLIGV